MKLRMLLSYIESLNKSIETINKHIEDILSLSSDKGSFPGQNLFTIPGIGPKTIATMLSLVGDTGATFENGTKLVGHIGFFPQIFKSGETKYANKISPKYARWGLYMCAVACIRHNKEMQHLYYNKLSQGKTEKQALVCVVKKITHMMLSMLKFGENYRPERVFMIRWGIHMSKSNRSLKTFTKIHDSLPLYIGASLFCTEHLSKTNKLKKQCCSDFYRGYPSINIMIQKSNFVKKKMHFLKKF